MPTSALGETMAFIEAHPNDHYQAEWMIIPEPSEDPFQEEFAPPCGTSACLAGWGVIHHQPQLAALWSHDMLKPEAVRHAAMKIFGITESQATTLFQGHWYRAQLRVGVDALYRDPDIDSERLGAIMSSALH